MDGFMGEANSSDSVQEQPKEQVAEQSAEQVKEPADQTNEQEKTKTAPAKASSKKETTKTAATEQIKSKLEAKRRENVGRPKKSESAKKPQEIRATFIVDPDLLRKVKYISLVEDILMKDVIFEALNNYVDAREAYNRKIKLPPIKMREYTTAISKL